MELIRTRIKMLLDSDAKGANLSPIDYELIALMSKHDELREALFRHREDLHQYSRRPCPTCRFSAKVLGLTKLVPDSCSIGWEKDERKLLDGD